MKTFGVNLSLLWLGFENLKTLEVDVAQPCDDCPSSDHVATTYHSFSLPKVTSLILRSTWEYIPKENSFGDFFEYIELPALIQVHLNLASHGFEIQRIPAGSFHHLLQRLENYDIQPQNLRITIDNDLEKSSSTPFCPFLPFDPRDGCLRRFQKLHAMSVPALALVAHSVHHHETPLPAYGGALTLDDLPPTLTHLEIMYPNAVTLDWLQDTFTTVTSSNHGVSTLTLLCGWTWGKPPAWFQHRRHILDGLSVRVVVDIAPGEKKPTGYIDPETSGIWEASCADGSWLGALFTED